MSELEPWDHPYESGEDGACHTCGWTGTYAHTKEFYDKGYDRTLPWERSDPWPARLSDPTP